MTRIPQLTEIKKLREELNISQRQLAKQCDIPSSFLSMIENQKNNTKPSYDVLVRIFQELDGESQKNLGKLTTADKICKTNLTSARKSDYAEDIIKIMHEKDFSQIPVLDGGGCIGMVTENSLMKFLQERTHKPLTTTELKMLWIPHQLLLILAQRSLRIFCLSLMIPSVCWYQIMQRLWD